MKRFAITHVPRTEEEVMQALRYPCDIITTAMQGIARCRIRMGDTPERAWEYALLYYLSLYKDRGNVEPVTPAAEPVTPTAEPVTPTR